MARTLKIRPPYSILLIADPAADTAPTGFGDSIIAFNGSCLAIGCLNAGDGETTITLGALRELALEGPPGFEGLVSTPTLKLGLYSAQWESFAELPVKNPRTRVKAWLNDDKEPDEIRIEYE